MNLVLLHPCDLERGLDVADPRVAHVRGVLGMADGEAFDAGLVHGPKGRARLRSVGTRVVVEFEAGTAVEPEEPLVLAVGLCRPQTVRKILREATALGVGEMVFFPCVRSEPSYADASIWKSGEVARLLEEGAAQAHTTRLPVVSLRTSIEEALEGIPAGHCKAAVDIYESAAPLGGPALPVRLPAALAVGPERGWDGRDRERLRAGGWSLFHLGPRILRTETAVVAGLTLLRSAAGLLSKPWGSGR